MTLCHVKWHSFIIIIFVIIIIILLLTFSEFLFVLHFLLVT